MVLIRYSFVSYVGRKCNIRCHESENSKEYKYKNTKKVSQTHFLRSPFTMSVFSRIKTIAETDLSTALGPNIFITDDVSLTLAFLLL